MSTSAAPAIIYSRPVRALAAQLRAEADTLSGNGITEAARILTRTAERIEARLAEAALPEMLTTADVAELRGVSTDAVAAQCRRRWAATGAARKHGGVWRISRAALEGSAP